VIKEYISNETKKELEILRRHHEEIKNYTPEQARQELINSGIYQSNGKLKSCYK
jgi:hypothetical protein